MKERKNAQKAFLACFFRKWNKLSSLCSIVGAIMLLIHLLVRGFFGENTRLKANGEGGDKRVTRDSLNNMPFAPF